MSKLCSFARTLSTAKDGAVAVEFALLGTILFGMLLGVLQVGIGMQNYNAVRNVSADVARYTMVQYETGNQLTNSQIRTYAISAAKGSPYLLDPDRVQITVVDAPTQRVAGARELTLRVNYTIPVVVGFLGMREPQMDYQRPIFLLNE